VRCRNIPFLLCEEVRLHGCSDKEKRPSQERLQERGIVVRGYVFEICDTRDVDYGSNGEEDDPGPGNDRGDES
jgi:hypothetical protein